MDPLSVIAGVVGIASGACSASQALFKLVDDIKGGPEQIQAISRDAHAFYSVIFSLRLALQDKNIRLIVSDDPSLVQMIDNLSRPLSNCQAVLGQLMVKIEARLKPTSDGRAFRMNKLDLRWGFFAKKEVKDLVARLEATKSTLDNALGSVTTFCSIRLLSKGKGSAAEELRRSSCDTDAGFALRRYLEESISSGSVICHSPSASTRNLEATEHYRETAAATIRSSSPKTRAPRQPNAGDVDISRAESNGAGVGTALVKLPASATTLEHPLETPVTVPSLGVGVSELDGEPVLAESPAETLGAIPAMYNSDESETRETKACVQVGPGEPQAASSSIAIAPTAVSLAPQKADTPTDANGFEISNNRLSIPDSTLPSPIADYARSLEDRAAAQYPTAAFLRPVSFNTLVEALDPKRPISDMKIVLLTTSLQLAVRYGDAVQTEQLLVAGADPNAKNLETGRNALEAASLVAQYPVKVADILHQRGANINQTDDEGWTLLHHATFRGRIREVRWLLRKGADMELISHGRRTIDGTILNWVTPLQIAASSKSSVSLSCLCELLQAGAGVETTADNGYAAINLAARTGSHHAIAKLLAAGAQLNNSNNLTHDTPLLEAIAHQQLEVVKYLLSLGAECIQHQIRFANTGFKLAEKLRRDKTGLECPISVEIHELVSEAARRPPIDTQTIGGAMVKTRQRRLVGAAAAIHKRSDPRHDT